MQLPVSAERNLEALPIPQHEIIMLAGYYETTIKEKLVFSKTKLPNNNLIADFGLNVP